jgi:peptidyl-prolyl cis-trans isomerase A (cyclophilin A)
VIITDVVVVDAAVVTNPNLTPVQNTLATPSNSIPNTSSNNGGSSGGAFGVWALLCLGIMLWRRSPVKTNK